MLRSSLLVLALLVGAPGPSSAQWPLTSCTPLGKNLFVRDVMWDLYLWSRHMPAANPARHSTPEAYLDAVRYRPLDDSFSFVTSRAASEAFFGESAFIGFGMSLRASGPEVRVLQVFPDSPASEAGLSRGARIVAVNGADTARLLADGTFDAALGPAREGVAADMTFLDGAGNRREARLVKRVVTIPTVSHVQIFRPGGIAVGYLFFRNFVQPSHAALDAAFAELAVDGVRDLVLDLRYNGGGLVSVAQHLGSLVGGLRTEGQVFARYVHNDRNLYRNEVLRFDSRPRALTLDRLIVITTRSSASASELVINALRPFIPVVVIGDRTFGKPVGQYQIPFCDKVLAPVSFTVRNADGVGDFFDGIAPTCPAPDDVDRELGDPLEASLQEALSFAATGRCTARRQGLARLTEAHETRPRPSGWQSVLNAY